MRARSWILALLIGSLANALVPYASVQAQEASDEGAERAAAEHHERGVRAFAAGRYRQAIELFRRADALKPSPAIAFNVGNAYEKLGDRTAAVSAYREYLRRAPDAKDARDVERRIQALKRAPAQSAVPQRMTIHSAPSGASLSIDGKPAGVTPHIAELPPGLHTLELELAGFGRVARVLEVRAGMADQVAFSMDAGSEPNAPHLAQPGPTPVFASAMSASTQAPRRATKRDERTSTVGVLGWVAVGGAAAAFGGALTLEILRRAEQDRARREQTQIGFHERVEAMNAQQTGARVLAVTGAALTAIGGTLLFVDATREEEREDAPISTGLAFTKDGASAMLRARY